MGEWDSEGCCVCADRRENRKRKKYINDAVEPMYRVYKMQKKQK